jgi:hypothetical protein
MNWTSRVAIAGRVAERRRHDNWDDLPMLGDYYLSFGKAEAKADDYLSFGKAEAKAEAAKWLCQV